MSQGPEGFAFLGEHLSIGVLKGQNARSLKWESIVEYASQARTVRVDHGQRIYASAAVSLASFMVRPFCLVLILARFFQIHHGILPRLAHQGAGFLSRSFNWCFCARPSSIMVTSVLLMQ